MEGLLITGGGPASFGWSLVTTFGIYKQPQVFLCYFWRVATGYMYFTDFMVFKQEDIL